MLFSISLIILFSIMRTFAWVYVRQYGSVVGNCIFLPYLPSVISMELYIFCKEWAYHQPESRSNRSIVTVS